jgi:hypothetical protein
MQLPTRLCQLPNILFQITQILDSSSSYREVGYASIRTAAAAAPGSRTFGCPDLRYDRSRMPVVTRRSRQQTETPAPTLTKRAEFQLQACLRNWNISAEDFQSFFQHGLTSESALRKLRKLSGLAS